MAIDSQVHTYSPRAQEAGVEWEGGMITILVWAM